MEGTQKYSAEQLIDELEIRGMTMVSEAGRIEMSMLTKDFTYGLEILCEVLCNATFPESALAKVRDLVSSDIKDFWDDPGTFADQLVRDHLYKGHQYSKNDLGTLESVASITRDDLLNFCKKYVVPFGAHCAIVGDLPAAEIRVAVQDILSAWQGSTVEDLVFPALPAVQKKVVTHPITRDQIVLCFGGRSVERMHPDFSALLLFDQIFTGGALASMGSRLFQLREESGLFYTVGGSILTHADEQPGIVFIRTIVSADRLEEAKESISAVIDSACNEITQQEYDDAYNAVIASLVGNFDSNRNMARSFLFLERYQLPADYFDTRAQELATVTIDDMKKAAGKILRSDSLLQVQIGRVQE